MAAFEQGDLAANLGSVEGTLLTMQAAREQRDFVNGSPQAHLINAVEFCLIFNGDLSSALHAIERAEADWERRFHVRVLVLVLHEATSGLGALLGKKFRRIVKQLGVEADLAALHALHSEIVVFTREHYAEHNAIRTNAIAHRDGDSLAQIRSIRASQHSYLQPLQGSM